MRFLTLLGQQRETQSITAHGSHHHRGSPEPGDSTAASRPRPTLGQRSSRRETRCWSSPSWVTQRRAVVQQPRLPSCHPEGTVPCPCPHWAPPKLGRGQSPHWDTPSRAVGGTYWQRKPIAGNRQRHKGRSKTTVHSKGSSLHVGGRSGRQL